MKKTEEFCRSLLATKIGKIKALCNLTFLDYSEDDDYILSAGMDNTLKKWHISSYPMGFVQDINGINDACFSPDGKRYVTASSEKKYAPIWNHKGESIAFLAGNNENETIKAISYSKNGNYIADFPENGKSLRFKIINIYLKIRKIETKSIIY